jgi:putative glutamine amidotransferase
MPSALIAIPAYPVLDSARIDRFSDDAVVVPVTYIRALRRAGGLEAILLPTSLDVDDTDTILERYDGLMLLGGGDLEPGTYGQDPHDTVYNIDTDRDDCELALTRAAIAREMPVLAICRGHQVLNVALGGTLDQHITDRGGLVGHGIPGADGTGQLHEVEIEEGSRLAAAMGTTRATCSSHHHQAVDDLGSGLRAVARAPDGIVEGIELGDTQGPWVVGAQWHPEDTAATDPAQQGLFDTFVEQAAKHRGER